MIEVRNDLLRDDDNVARAAAILEKLLTFALADGADAA